MPVRLKQKMTLEKYGLDFEGEIMSFVPFLANL